MSNGVVNQLAFFWHKFPIWKIGQIIWVLFWKHKIGWSFAISNYRG
jgi:hypothetical protein